MRSVVRKGSISASNSAVKAIYPDGFETVVTVPEIARRWEGEIRPHHFAGVAAVVTKLFGIVRPEIAVCGQKDFQQAALVRRMIEELSLGVKLIVHPTVREQDGLAMSSGNVYLSGTDRTLAPILYKGLQVGAAAIRDGVTAGRQIQLMMTQVLRRESAATVDYLAACDPGHPHTDRIRERSDGPAGSHPHRERTAHR